MFKKVFIFVLLFVILIPTNAYGYESFAKSAVVIDAENNEVLYSKNYNAELPMASTTKIMTALITCEHCKKNDVITVDEKMLNVDGTSLGLKKGDKLSVYDTVVGMMLTSGNDAANVLAFYISGSKEAFAKLMNEKAKAIGMKNTEFVTPSGLDEGNHHSSAYDMALLTSEALKDKMFSDICKMKSAEITINKEKKTVYNHNKLLTMDKDCIGVKTGFTEKSGRCLVSAVKKNGHTLICVTLNDANDWDDHISLYKICIKKYKKISVSKEFRAEIVGAGKASFNVGYNADIYVTNENYSTCEYYYKIIYAPIKKGDVIGYADILCKDKKIKRVNIISFENVE